MGNLKIIVRLDIIYIYISIFTKIWDDDMHSLLSLASVHVDRFKRMDG
jgi:hypothetical protein